MLIESPAGKTKIFKKLGEDDLQKGMHTFAPPKRPASDTE
jgi:hypothetical protein